MLLSNGNVEIPLREALGERQKIRAFTHGGGDPHNAVVGFCGVAEPLAKHVGVFQLRRLRSNRFWLAGRHRFDLVDGMVADWIGFGRGETLALGGDHVEELRSVQFADVLQSLQQQRQVVAVDWADVVEP